jgi:hypothetical protein
VDYTEQKRTSACICGDGLVLLSFRNYFDTSSGPLILASLISSVQWLQPAHDVFVYLWIPYLAFISVEIRSIDFEISSLCPMY